jgi:hypothetical protein
MLPPLAPAVFPIDVATQSPLQKQYLNLTREHLDGLVDVLFTKTSGLHFQITWTPLFLKHGDASTHPVASPVCCRLSDSPLLPESTTCGQKQLNLALNSHEEDH